MRAATSSRPAPARSRYRPPPDSAVHAGGLEALLFGRLVPESQQGRLAFGPAGTVPRVWFVGDAAVLDRPAVAIVGSRKASPEGLARARRLARELAAAGVTIVSGLADGIDTAALTAALDAGGRGAAVIGTPLDRAYPAANAALQERIYSEHLLVSPFPIGAPVRPGNFPHRNKVMAALSDATAIMEAGDTSGTIHQAAECVRLTRWLFIANAIVSDREITWPGGFIGDDKPRATVLRTTADVLDVLRDREG